MSDHHFMSIALKLAERGLGNVAPNPSVGCVIVKDNVIISEGWTGTAHAEVIALKNAKGSVRGATMYVTLEPCCHYGVTGPCTLEIIKSGIKRVVVAIIDPDERVSGKGIQELKDAGIKITCGIMAKEAEKLNVGFFFTKKLHRPFITCKIASTLDGKIATFTNESKWITSEDTRNWVHELRAKYDAIMIGSNTLIHDNPLLTCRLPGLEDRSPMRLIIDSQTKLTKEHNIAKTADKIKTWVITKNEVREKIKNINYLITNTNKNGKICLKDMVSKLVSDVGITRVLVEGGGVLITELLKHQLIDRLIICRSGKILGNDAIPFIGNLGIQSISQCYKFKKVKIIDFVDDIVEIWDAE
ncbi:MAG TPA: bifunctional diaminohydroxyphosphoribosylaminopyrimidine deaminase/5-amino-6-(5-phosphoribosylamino)uracil reductase RibD [Wolbachia sp.]|uniref:bifunctional diaminohydroxyphosphoribosylaminopyrimidine deaminase/5-amino-6-(5-phosphoribosylamino)uracil reductase RibD n=1 Tax=Wolbachia endosymbiont of Pentalonia nigronervosa TaxID=1301914 RepID=UPI000EF0AE58|nr:bifunctional diaminohydroxyphosphoribosylaminopyrimidine deaminase/5-amino-6-(5-phosphoribosylamino)uracil reductase RibD [Wolbachia endosymbiont of Pentalonia nigronervosa]MBD0391844.1 bifunctional diaminohydroxyphosphoribosylaminopyrimidine deaminase/5-amino-6-(5-phosphoribosylamino)uracil reductase RibD [Wolbachia endosymbiont of Pentalonia nigronervosa]HCE59802.1 bifunctional diaminohydroxyphosphoribosylaminopyrimidine deaminase/5-amino-6-(5-phosphoribosylamino)uracil reductase RibD [Wolba